MGTAPWLEELRDANLELSAKRASSNCKRRRLTTIDDEGKVTGITDALVESAAYPVAFTDKVAELHHDWLAIVSAARARVQ